jgi:hypothetical protein
LAKLTLASQGWAIWIRLPALLLIDLPNWLRSSVLNRGLDHFPRPLLH